MKIDLRHVIAGVLGLLIIVASGMVLGCSSSPSTDGATSSTTTTDLSAGATPSTDAVSTTTPPITLSSDDRELAKTAMIKNSLAGALADDNVPQDDPRMAIIFGLRARMQALSCEKALTDGDLEPARTAMTDVYTTLNLGRNIAQGSVADLLNQAHEVIATLGDPSNDPQQAALLLAKFVDVLAPLLDQAAELTPTTSTTF